ncbi:GNAT family N-acetyltransferase [Acinetobacter sp. ANC 3791]|uniref:GNAT family N-acetyltransferase n=1 Tax=Acinetobacter sp. ANC 3791 TaxID=2529836 RepID=UPI001039C939|nr:GNAT family N-acetyltransferase [Acinetobacter sp. ANC 3791]TCB84558.1 GNAT family N-acetyltransferase [Acinetobacter sp. ANC 3791]
MLIEATQQHIPDIVELVNLSYRSQDLRGWTSEADVIEGDRISAQQLQDLFITDSKILLWFDAAALIACVHVQKHKDQAYIGMLTTHPHWQNQGLGKQVLQFAEDFAQANFAVTGFKMSVLSCRTELIEFYLRRGYVLTGETEDYPIDANVGQPLFEDIRLLHLKKLVR